jgi:UDP-glucuronate decarboxylase
MAILCYDEGKRCAETLCFDYFRQHKVKIKVARIFNTYGPRMHVGDGRVVSNFIVRALKGENIRVHGDGSQTRSFCFVDDLVEGLLRLLFSATDLTGPINLGRSEEFTILDLAWQVLELTGSRSEIEFSPLPADDPRQRRPDTALARSALNWEAKTSLKEGLKPTIEYFSQQISRPAGVLTVSDGVAPAASARQGSGGRP